MSYHGHRPSSGLFNHAHRPPFAEEDRALSRAAAERHQQLRAVRERQENARSVTEQRSAVLAWARARVVAPLVGRTTP